MVHATMGVCLWCGVDSVLTSTHGVEVFCRSCESVAYVRAKQLGVDIEELIKYIRTNGTPSAPVGKTTTKEVMEQNRKLLAVMREIANGNEYHYGYSRAKCLAQQVLEEIRNGPKDKNEEPARLPEEKGVHEERGAE